MILRRTIFCFFFGLHMLLDRKPTYFAEEAFFTSVGYLDLQSKTSLSFIILDVLRGTQCRRHGGQEGAVQRLLVPPISVYSKCAFGTSRNGKTIV